MATISKIKNKSGIRWKALIRRGVRSKSKTFRLKSSAVAWAEQMERGDELAIALNCPGAAMRFEELAEAYMRDYSGKDHTRANRVKFWVERIGKTRLTDISATMIKKHLEDYLSGCALSYGGVGPDLKTRTRKLDRKRSPASRNRMKAGLAAVLAYAREREYLPAGPTVTSTVPILKENNKRQRYLSDDERERLFHACRESDYDRLYLLVLMGATTGARLGEILGRTWSEVDFKENVIHLATSKNEEPRVLTLIDSVIKEMNKFRGVGNALIFPGMRRTTRPFSGWRAHWHKAREKAGVGDLHFHDLRHSVASSMLRGGYGLDVIAQVLGHKSIQTSRRYAHLDTGTKKRAIQDVFGKVGENGDDD